MSSERARPEPIPQGQRYRYGCRMEVLATNQPLDVCLFDSASSHETFSVAKGVFTVQNHELEQLFSTDIKPAIVDLLLRSSIPKECAWTLQVFRMGFRSHPKDNPVVVHLCVAPGHLSDREACNYIAEINAVISAAQWGGENIYVDICQGFNIESELRMIEEEKPHIDLSDHFSELYEYSPPCPGFSVGPEDNYRCAGSLTGFIKHENHIYGLTCEHVLNSSTKILGSGPYRYKDGETEFNVSMPAARDHDETKVAISSKLRGFARTIVRAEERRATNLISSRHYDRILETALPGEKHWEKAEQKANDYKTYIGKVYATSGSDKSKQFYCGVLDWGIFDTSFNNIRNKHPSYSAFDRGSGFQLIGKERSLIADKPGEAFIEDAGIYFYDGPEVKPLQEEGPQRDQVYFKPASRSMEWRACKCNGIMSTLKDDQDMVTDEYCFIGRGMGEPISAKGDSGTPLFDKDFRPTAMLWGGLEHFAGFKDVTYATPLAVILGDIERRMGWEEGSVSYC